MKKKEQDWYINEIEQQLITSSEEIRSTAMKIRDENNELKQKLAYYKDNTGWAYALAVLSWLFLAYILGKKGLW